MDPPEVLSVVYRVSVYEGLFVEIVVKEPQTVESKRSIHAVGINMKVVTRVRSLLQKFFESGVNANNLLIVGVACDRIEE